MEGIRYKTRQALMLNFAMLSLFAKYKQNGITHTYFYKLLKKCGMGEKSATEFKRSGWKI